MAMSCFLRLCMRNCRLLGRDVGSLLEAKTCILDGRLPANLSIALARCAFAPDEPAISFKEAEAYLQDALKEDTYIDALELLGRTYIHLEDLERAKEVQSTIASIGSKGIRSHRLCLLCFRGV